MTAELSAEVLDFQDVSTPRVKRYSSVVVAGARTGEELAEFLADITEQLKTNTFHRDEPMRNRWAGKPAQVVWLYVARDQEAARKSRWICRTQWIDPELKEYRSLPLDGAERVGEMLIQWHEERGRP